MNVPIANRAIAGRTFPIKFALEDATGRFISDPAAIAGITLASRVCGAAAADVAGEDTVVNPEGLKYDPTTGVWHFNWQTLKSQAGCWQLEVRLADASVHPVAFELR